MLDIFRANCSRILISLMCCGKCSFAFVATPLQCINSFYGGCFLCMASTWSKRQLTIERFSEVTEHIKRIVSKTPTKIFNFWLSVEPATSGLLSPISPASPDNLCSPLPALHRCPCARICLHRTHLPFHAHPSTHRVRLEHPPGSSHTAADSDSVGSWKFVPRPDCSSEHVHQPAEQQC